jgi:hypothetical protein
MNIKATFFSLAVCLLFATPVHAQAQLFGTYAEHTNWGCTNFQPGFTGVNGTTQFTTAGEISYYGDGTAEGVGRFTVTDTSAGPGAATSDIGRYECNWTYVVHEIETPDCNIAGPNPAVGLPALRSSIRSGTGGLARPQKPRSSPARSSLQVRTLIPGCF